MSFKIRFFSSKVVLQCCLLFCVALSGAAQAQSKQIPAPAFFQNTQFSSARLSPDGTALAMLMADKNDRMVLAVLEIGQKQAKVIAGYEVRDISHFQWVNNTRLVYDLSNRKLAKGENFFGPGLYAVNKDGSGRLQLVSHTRSLQLLNKTDALLPWNTFFLDTVHDSSSSDIFVTQAVVTESDQNTAYDLYRLNTKTGNTEMIQRPGKVSQWLIDKKGVPRIAKTIDGSSIKLQYKDPDTGVWRVISETNWSSKTDLEPVFFSPEGDLYVSAYQGQNLSSLYVFDLKKNQLETAPVISLKGYDFNGNFVYNTAQKKVLGLHYEMGTSDSVWFDDAMKARQKNIDTLLPHTVNQISIAEESNGATVLVHSFSDIDPGAWYLHDEKTNQLTRLGNSQPGINPELMSPKEQISYSARDGLTIPAYLTVPKFSNGKNLAMVMLVHGGPYVRGGHWQWDSQVQFLASRGYAVLEADFRGSTGYGQKHFNAGLKQWGLAMQDDIADGVRWAIAKGVADPKRICIAGGSYGGYATLMGLIKDPQLYRCGINWVGVTDINLLYDIHWSDLRDEWKNYGMPVLVGDQIKDAAQLKATSPLEHADQIKQPLLLAYGGADRRVPLPHGQKFYAAVKTGNPQVEWVEYEEEGHGFRLLKNKLDFWTRAEKFLGQHLAPE